MHKRKPFGVLTDRHIQSYRALIDDLGYHAAALAKYAHGLHALYLTNRQLLNEHALDHFETMIQTHHANINQIVDALYAQGETQKQEGGE